MSSAASATASAGKAESVFEGLLPTNPGSYEELHKKTKGLLFLNNFYFIL